MKTNITGRVKERKKRHSVRDCSGMNKIKKIVSSRLGFALTANIVALVAATVFFRQYWEEDDDIWISFLTEGAFGDYEPHVLFSNFIYGKLLCSLQYFMPRVRWHAVLELFFVFVISTAFIYVLGNDNRGKIISIVFLIGIVYEIYVALQFSKIPAFISTTAYIILFELVYDKEFSAKTKRFLCIIAWVCLFFAIILRIDSFLLGTLVAGVYGIVRVIREAVNREFIGNLRKYCLYFLPVLFIFCLCLLADHVGFRDPEWNWARKYEKLNGLIVDYNHDALDYDKHGKELADIGVSENDAFMILTWQFADDEFMTPERIRRIAAIGPTGLQKIDMDMLKAWVANIHETILVLNPLVMAILMILALYIGFLISHEGRSYNMAITISQALLAMGVLFWYQYSGRWSHRIVYAFLLCQFVLFVYLLKQEEEIIIQPTLVHCIMAVLLFALFTMRLTNEFEYQGYKRMMFDQQALIEFMKDNKDSLFVADAFTLQNLDKYNVFIASEKGQFENLTMSGGSYCNSPLDKRIVRSFGYENPFMALEGHDDHVILIDNIFPDKKVQYCNEHGDGTGYQLDKLGSVGGLDMYNIKKQEDQ